MLLSNNNPTGLHGNTPRDSIVEYVKSISVCPYNSASCRKLDTPHRRKRWELERIFLYKSAIVICLAGHMRFSVF